MAHEEEFKKKEFKFKGKSIEELKELDTREFAKFVPSRARRTILRQFREIEDFVNRAAKKISRKKTIRTHQRDLIIVPKMVGMKVHVYSGKEFMPVEIVGEMLGMRLGEFAPTRARIKHGSAGIGATKGSKFKSKK